MENEECQCTLAWIEDHKTELKNPSDKYLPILVSINSQDLSIRRTMKETETSTAIYKVLADIAKVRAFRMRRNDNSNSMAAFVTAIKRKYSSNNNMDWTKMGEACFNIFRGLPNIPMLSRNMTQKQTARKQNEVINEKKTSSFQRNATNVTNKEPDKRIENFQKKFKSTVKQEGVNLSYLYDSKNPEKTIENALCFAHMVNIGEAGLSIKENETKIIKTQPLMNHNNSHQGVLTIDINNLLAKKRRKINKENNSNSQ